LRQQHRGAAWCKLVGLTTVAVLTAFADPGMALGQSERGSVAGYDFEVNVHERLIPPRRPPELVRFSESLSWLHVDGDRPGGDGVTRVLDISFGRAEGRRGATLSLAASGAVLEASGRITINARPPLPLPPGTVRGRLEVGATWVDTLALAAEHEASSRVGGAYEPPPCWVTRSLTVGPCGFSPTAPRSTPESGSSPLSVRSMT